MYSVSDSCRRVATSGGTAHGERDARQSRLSRRRVKGGGGGIASTDRSMSTSTAPVASSCRAARNRREQAAVPNLPLHIVQAVWQSSLLASLLLASICASGDGTLLCMSAGPR